MLILAGCSVGREYQVPETESLIHAQFLEQEQGRFRATEPIAHWWRNLNEDLLSQLVEQALEHNLDVRIALANFQEARFFVGRDQI